VKAAARMSVVLLLAASADAGPMDYPPAPRSGQSDVYHGRQVADPYRWLEALDSAEARAWIAAQNALARRYLDGLPARGFFAEQVRRLLCYERYGIPQHRRGRYLYTYNDGLAEQDSLWVSDDPARPGRVLVDPLRVRADGTVSVAAYELSPDGDKLAYALSDGGSDWTTWHVMDVRSARELGEPLRGTKFTHVAWTGDSRGFFYSRYPASAAAYDDRRQVAIWYHALDSVQSKDRRIFAIEDHPTRNPYPQVTADGHYLIIRVEDGYQSNGIYYLDLRRAGAGVSRLLDRWDGRYDFLGNEGPVFFFHTTQGAAAGRIIAIDSRNPAPEQWREVVAEAPEAIEQASMAGGRLFVSYIVDVRSQVRVFGLDGKRLADVPLPGAGTTDGFEGLPGDTAVYFSYSDFATPRTIYRFDVSDSRAVPLRPPAAAAAAPEMVTRQAWVISRDGTRVPMYIVHRRDLDTEAPRPTVLYGYGGFNVSLLPAYSAARAAWIAAGGVYAVANLRGGGEFGERWHESGTRLNKQNVFDDFIAAAEWLIGNGYTTPRQLAIWGGSNGGLLVGAVLNQHPELFAAAVPAVGVMDMLRYQLASANAQQWSSDYGQSDNPAEFGALYAYSPYHNVRPGTCYPATLVMADANDDRVVPWHSYKYAAALQAAQGCEQPVLIRIETRAGHGAGAAISKLAEEYADQWAFIAAATGLKPGAQGD